MIDKPAGLPSQATRDPSRSHAYGAVLARERAARGRAAYAGLHHRLDRDTSGVLAFTRSRRANKGFAEQVSGHGINKVYLALALGSPPADEWAQRDHLRKIPGPVSRVRSVRSGGDAAETAFRVVHRLDGAALIEARPRTGRMHQIRVHLAEAGLPIAGDALYGGKGAAPRALLHARRLEFEHPVTRAPLALETPMPDDFERAIAERAAVTKFALEAPSLAMRESFLRMARGFAREGLGWWADERVNEIERDFEAYVRSLLDARENPPTGWVPHVEFWPIVDDGREVAGRIAIRLQLNDDLEKLGGHVGYDVAAPFRRRGIATRMLAEAIGRAGALGLDRVLVTCAENNVASYRAIERNGGALQDIVEVGPERRRTRRYWIDARGALPK